MIHARIRELALAALLCMAATGTAIAHDDDDHGPGSQEVKAGAFHVHLVPVGSGFEVHVHDAATHKSVDLARATTKATLLADGKTSVLPLAVKGTGILSSKQALPQRWTLLVALNVPGQKPAQARFSSTQMGKHAH
jgi:hypothetical protein